MGKNLNLETWAPSSNWAKTVDRMVWPLKIQFLTHEDPVAWENEAPQLLCVYGGKSTCKDPYNVLDQCHCLQAHSSYYRGFRKEKETNARVTGGWKKWVDAEEKADGGGFVVWKYLKGCPEEVSDMISQCREPRKEKKTLRRNIGWPSCDETVTSVTN